MVRFDGGRLGGRRQGSVFGVKLCIVGQCSAGAMGASVVGVRV